MAAVPSPGFVPPRRLEALAELGALRPLLNRTAQIKPEARTPARPAAALQEADFGQEVGQVKPLKQAERVRLVAPLPAPVPEQSLKDQAEVLREALQSPVTPDTLLETDAALGFCRFGIGPDVLTRLRRGDWAVQGQLDLHGLRSDAARQALSQFLAQAQRQGLRCLRVVHGKGLGSPGKTPVLKPRVARWLEHSASVLAYVQATPLHGGAGALLVLLQPAQAPAVRHRA